MCWYVVYLYYNYFFVIHLKKIIMPMIVFCLDLVSYVVILIDFSGNFESWLKRGWQDKLKEGLAHCFPASWNTDCLFIKPT